ncbi:MAG: glutamine synthetase, partial [Rhodospirillales bacterium]|nr:glutamine synthetase [Rhodospirillales bacterium]
MHPIDQYLRDHKIEEVECLVPDMAGIARGKILPAQKFLKGMRSEGLRIADSVFSQTVTGGYPDEAVLSETVGDVYLVPDPQTIRMVPWYGEPTAQVICNAFGFDGAPIPIASRYVLKRVLDLYKERGWQPVVAPELEFFLVDVNTDPDYPLVPPIGRSGRRETSRQAFGLDAVNEFDPLFEEVYDFCEVQEIDIDTLIHEAGAAQMEMNFNHGPALELADQAFLFKRTVREAALRHKVYATFMAKPMRGEPGSSMHIHQSVIDM